MISECSFFTASYSGIWLHCILLSSLISLSILMDFFEVFLLLTHLPFPQSCLCLFVLVYVFHVRCFPQILVSVYI